MGALLVLGISASGSLVWYLVQEHEKTVAARKKAQTYAVATEAQGSVSEALANMVSCLSGAQAQVPAAKDFEKKLAQGGEGKYASAGRQIKEQCTPAFRKALAQIGAKLDIPAWEDVQQSGGAFADRADQYASTLAAHAAVDQADHRINEAAQAWSDSEGKSEQALRFESFLICALPDPRARVDANTFSNGRPSIARKMGRIRSAFVPNAYPSSTPATSTRPTRSTPFSKPFATRKCQRRTGK